MLIHAYKQARDTIKKANQNPPLFPHHLNVEMSTHTDHPKDPVRARNQDFPGALATPLPVTTVHSRSLPSPVSVDMPSLSRSDSSVSDTSASFASPPTPKTKSPPDYAHPPLDLLVTILCPSSFSAESSTQGSFSTALALRNVLSLILTSVSPFVARLLPYLLYTHVLSYARLTGIVRSARNALFPEGWPAPPPVDPTPEEQIAMREQLGRRVLDNIPGI